MTLFNVFIFVLPVLSALLAAYANWRWNLAVRTLRWALILVCAAIFVGMFMIVTDHTNSMGLDQNGKDTFTSVGIAAVGAFLVFLFGPSVTIRWKAIKARLDQTPTSPRSGERNGEPPKRQGGRLSGTELEQVFILLVGDQLVGKTQLIRSLCGSYVPVRPDERTGDDSSRRYEIVKGPIYGNQELVLIDHRGQDLASISEALAGAKVSGADVSAVIFMTDLFGFPSQDAHNEEEWHRILEGLMSKKEDAPHDDRVDHHLQQLSQGSLQQLFGNNNIGGKPKRGRGLKTLFLFINKVDRLKEWDRDLRAESYLKPFEDIHDHLLQIRDNMKKEYNVDLRVGWTAGSALHGWGITGQNALLDCLLQQVDG